MPITPALRAIAELVRQRLAFLLEHVGDRDDRALPREQTCRRGAHAPRAARDDRYLVLHPVH
jgi:hypothetical protein